MSAPTTHDPIAVTTKDGTSWVRRAVTRDGRGLYAVDGSCKCPEFLMATLAELAELGIAGMADALPMPAGPARSEREELRAAFVAALNVAARTHPCPALGDQYWSGCVHYDEAGHVAGVGSCHSERRADAVLAVRDAKVERLTARVAELEADLLVANGVLEDVAQARRNGAACPCPSADRPHQVGCPQDGVPVASLREPEAVSSPSFAERAAAETDPGRRTAWRMLARDVADGEHYPFAHHDYRVSHDLPETGGQR